MIENELTPGSTEPVRRPVTGGMVVAAGSRVAVAITGAGATVAVARLLGPAGSGAFAVGQTVLIIATTLATFGMDHGILYFVSSGAWDAAEAHRTSQRLAFGLGLAGAGVLMLIRVAIPAAFHGLSIWTSLMLAAAVPFALSWLYTSIISLGTDDYEGYVLPPAVQSVAALALVAGLAAWRAVTGAVAGLTVAHVITSLLALDRRRRLGRRVGAAVHEAGRSPQSRQSPAAQALRFGLKGYTANALQFLNLRLDLLILNALVRTADVGHYAVAVSVTSVMWLLPWALSDILLPRVAALANGTGEDMTLEMVEVKSLRHNAMITLCMSVLLAAVLLWLIGPIYGSRFDAAIDLGLILLPGVALLALAAPMTATITGRGQPGLLLVSSLIVTPITIGLYAGLIPALGATGAALASTASYAATFIISATLYGRVTGRSVWAMIPSRSELVDYRMLADRVLGAARRSLSAR